MEISGKVWGNTQLIFRNNNFEIHRIEVNKGGFCSKHKHNHKSNGFFMESGELEIQVWKMDYNLCDKTLLKPKQFSIVKPGEFHMFLALTDVIAYEIYWVDLDPSDIVREICGGVKE